MIRTAFPRPRDDDSEDVIWALSTAHALWLKEHAADALVWLQRASKAAADSGEAFRAEELAHAARTLRIALEDEALESLPRPPSRRPPPPSPAPNSTRRAASTDTRELFPPPITPVPGGDDFLDPWAERTPVHPPPPDSSVFTSALPLDELRRNSKRPPPPVEDEASTIPTWRPDAPTAPDAQEQEPATTTQPAAPILEDGSALSLDEVAAFADLPDDARHELVTLARIERLEVGEEIAVAGLMLIAEGVGHIQPAVLESTAAIVKANEVVYARGTLARNVELRIVAESEPVSVAVWSDEVITLALTSLPWVIEELRGAADRLQALSGAALGKLGERLDPALRQAVLERLEARVVHEGELFAERGRPIPGMAIVGAGALILETSDSVERLHPGDLLFPTEVLGGGAAPANVRGGTGGALILFGRRALAQELLVTWPPLLEVFGGF